MLHTTVVFAMKSRRCQLGYQAHKDIGLFGRSLGGLGDAAGWLDWMDGTVRIEH